MISAGDHERLPKQDDEGKEGSIDLKKSSKFKTQKLDAEMKYRLRKHLPADRQGKFNMFNEREDEELKVIPKTSFPSGAVRNSSGLPEREVNSDMRQLLDAARQSKSGIKMRTDMNQGK